MSLSRCHIITRTPQLSFSAIQPRAKQQLWPERRQQNLMGVHSYSRFLSFSRQTSWEGKTLYLDGLDEQRAKSDYGRGALTAFGDA